MRAKYKPSDYAAFRKRCAEMKEAGWRQNDITAAPDSRYFFKVWVSQTLKKYRESGAQGLFGSEGRRCPPRLSADQLVNLVEQLKRGAQHHGISGQVWTRQRVRLIEKLFGVSYNPTQVGRILERR